MSEPFYFYTRFFLVNLLNVKAKNPVELLECLKSIPTSSIYYHTHRFLEQHHYLSPEPANDFAYWLSDILNLKELGELFSGLDTVSFKNLEELRLNFINILTTYINKKKTIVDCQEGQEFHFISCISFIIPINYVAYSVKDFIEILKKISINSLYFHIFEARLRLERDENDFSRWFKSLGMNNLAMEISKLDPYTCSLESLREKIIFLVDKYAKY